MPSVDLALSALRCAFVSGVLYSPLAMMRALPVHEAVPAALVSVHFACGCMAVHYVQWRYRSLFVTYQSTQTHYYSSTCRGVPGHLNEDL
jgi:hypothetical protein